MSSKINALRLLLACQGMCTTIYYTKHSSVTPCITRFAASRWSESLSNSIFSIWLHVQAGREGGGLCGNLKSCHMRTLTLYKRKCFNQAGCCCAKKHAHVKEIISNCQNPSRRSLRVLSRAVQCILKCSGRDTWVVLDSKGCPRAGEATYRVFEAWLWKMPQVW